MSLVFATTFFFVCFFLIGGGLRHSAVQTDFEFEISGPLVPIPCDIHVLIKLRHPFVKNSSFVYESFKQKCKKKMQY